jgi:predicted nuclease of predicted toxin-antitoxin system
LSIALENNALLITEDKDFRELVFRLQLPHHGILLIRIGEAEYKIFSVAAAIKEHYDELINEFSVINNNKLRIKGYY